MNSVNSGRKVEEGESKNEKKETRKVLKVGDQNLTQSTPKNKIFFFFFSSS